MKAMREQESICWSLAIVLLINQFESDSGNRVKCEWLCKLVFNYHLNKMNCSAKPLQYILSPENKL